MLPTPAIEITWRVPWSDDSSFIPSASLAGGEEVLFVYLGASSCVWSNVGDLPEAVRSIRNQWYEFARANGKGFATVGVARDVIVDEGMKHLTKYGLFDEVVAGRGWLNIGFFKYVYGEMAGPAATPQVLIIERTVNRIAGQTWISNEQVVHRFVGANEILNELGSE